jgi:hypothetical protein
MYGKQQFTAQSVLRQDHYLFPSEVSRECKLVLRLSNSSVFSSISCLRLLNHFLVPSVFPLATKYAVAIMPDVAPARWTLLWQEGGGEDEYTFSRLGCNVLVMLNTGDGLSDRKAVVYKVMSVISVGDWCHCTFPTPLM